MEWLSNDLQKWPLEYGVQFSGIPSLKHHPLFTIDFVHDNDGCYYIYIPRNKSLTSRILINQTVHALQSFLLIEGNQTWEKYSNLPIDICDNYNLCGSFRHCDMGESPVCQCLRGFKPKSPQNWIAKD